MWYWTQVAHGRVENQFVLVVHLYSLALTLSFRITLLKLCYLLYYCCLLIFHHIHFLSFKLQEISNVIFWARPISFCTFALYVYSSLSRQTKKVFSADWLSHLLLFNHSMWLELLQRHWFDFHLISTNFGSRYHLLLLVYFLALIQYSLLPIVYPYLMSETCSQLWSYYLPPLSIQALQPAILPWFFSPQLAFVVCYSEFCESTLFSNVPFLCRAPLFSKLPQPFSWAFYFSSEMQLSHQWTSPTSVELIPWNLHISFVFPTACSMTGWQWSFQFVW